MPRTTVAIIGSGAAGMITAHQLIQGATKPLEVLLFDSVSHEGIGVAYATTCPQHLLNVPADFMGIEHLHPLHFVQWLKSYPELWRGLDPSFQTLHLEDGSFAPRMIYGAYLKHCWLQMGKLAQQKSVLLRHVCEEVVSIHYQGHGNLTLNTSAEACYEANAAVLAIGISWKTIHLDNRMNAACGYLENLWPHMTSMDKARQLGSRLPPTSTLGIIGSGLTMLDALATLDAIGYLGRIVVLSRTCLLPQAHAPAARHTPVEIPAYEEFPTTAREIVKLVRQRCTSSPNWRSVIQGIRMIANHLWQRMSLKEKQRFMRHAFGIWNSVRHRAPQQALKLFEALRQSGRLEMCRGRVTSIHPTASGKVAVLSKKGMQELDCVVNCCGPNFNLRTHTSPLLRNLIHKGLVQADETGLGVAIDNTGKVDSSHPHPIWVVGALSFGTYFEATSIPDIRRQAHLAATSILT